MSILQLAKHARDMNLKNPPVGLYRAILRELPRVITVYDLEVPVPAARVAVREMFRKNDGVKDTAVRSMLVEKGYMELEETLLQWKQKAQIMRLFEGYVQYDQGHLKTKPKDGDFLAEFYKS
mmetsp:Transcript_29206/g.45389  ORF Transcript_29206/g.45389 Transcript_29206/m.45389 type:complete len:122 (+) Transcript_29206:68-433(+)|eukprot:CAMPEP_0196809516 /NCGR_PEP_ID=MMETSP1362-20130617/9443_1 /TAXON_ID=163516 /ORGANISM="Leptocylindrus danicus, Strain CCMP1856" /LENGTH=121 /DNA_ID=CAMNT_0042184231 /DNA_START=67 /DNA_END=432 /DNA_ORIENTATION=+